MIPPSRAHSLRSVLGSTIAVGVSAFWWWKTEALWAACLVGLTGGLLVLAVFAPRAYAPVQRAVDVFARGILIVVTWLLLASVFCLIFVPGRVLQHLRGRDPLGRRFDPAANSYWSAPRDGGRPVQFDRQY